KTDEFEYEGDVEVRNVDILDIVWDFSNKDRWEDLNWVATKCVRNKWDLIARFPDQKDAILGASSEKSDRALDDSEREAEQDDDSIVVWEFFHRKTDALPDGKYVLFVGDKPLLEMPLPYPRIPIYPVYAGHGRKTLLGFSPLWDLQAQQEYLNALLTNLATVHDTLGLPLLWVKTGSKT